MARIIGSPYQSSGICDTHLDSDWQVATDINFTNIINESLDDNVNLEEINFNINTLDTPLYFRARYKSNTCASLWSDIVEETIYSSNLVPFVLTPSLTIDVVRNINGIDNRHEVLEINLTGSSFIVDNGTANHLNTSWIIEDTFGNVVWESLNDAVNLETITIPNPSWFKLETIYRFKVFYRSDALTPSGDPVDSQPRVVDYSLSNTFNEELKTLIPQTTIPTGLYTPQQKLEDTVLISLEDSALNLNNILYIVPVYLQPDPDNATIYDGLNLEIYKSDVSTFTLTNIGVFNIQSLFVDPTIELKLFSGTKINLSDGNLITEDTIALLIDSHIQNAPTRKIKGYKLKISDSAIISLEENAGNELTYNEYNLFDILKNQAKDFDFGEIGLRVGEFYYFYRASPSASDPNILEDNFIPLNPKITYDLTDAIWTEDLRGSGIAIGEHGEFLSIAGFLQNSPESTVNIFANNLFSSNEAGNDKWFTKEIVNFTNTWAATGSVTFDSGKVVVFYNTYKAPYSGDPSTDIVTTGRLILDNGLINQETPFETTSFINRKFLKLNDGTVIGFGGYQYTLDNSNEVISPNKTIIRLF